MRLILTTLAALGLATGVAFAGCAGHSAEKERPDQVTQMPVDTSIQTSSVQLEN